MTESFENGYCKSIEGVDRVFYDGYWIKCYEAPEDSLVDKKHLIQSLTRRLFNHMEHGINIPGRLLDRVREAYEAENDPGKKRVKGAMLAGALFNRGADIFSQLVDLEACGVKIEPGNDLRRACGECLQEALKYGRLAKHRNGDEGIDELWGEPFKAFIMSIGDFYQSRYIKISLTMRNIDEVAASMIGCMQDDPGFSEIEHLILDYTAKARIKCETLRTDKDIFDVWADFVVAGEKIQDFQTADQDQIPGNNMLDRIDSHHLRQKGVKLIAHITRARTSMPKSTQNFVNECQRFSNRG